MIRPIDIRLNAAHPELKLPEAVTYTGAPATVLIRGVPPNCGRWAITAVSVAATFPDGSTTTRAAVQSANGVWVATLPATATSGRTTDGFRVLADGIDENGEAATGYILAVADFAVATLDVTPAPQPGETSYQMLYFDAAPSTLRKGDVTKMDGVLKFYNGTAWEPFAAPVTFDNAVTKNSTNGVKSSGIWAAIWGALASLPTGVSSLYDWCVSQLSGKASTADVVLSERKEWVCDPATLYDGAYDVGVVPATGAGAWQFAVRPSGSSSGWLPVGTPTGTSTSTSLSQTVSGLPGGERTLTATLTATSGYVLGSQTDKPLASEAEAEALRAGKANDADVVHRTGNETIAGSKTFTSGIIVATGSTQVMYSSGIFVSGGATIGFPAYSGTMAMNTDLPYAFVTKTIDNGAVTLDDRAINAVAVSSSLASLTVNFPTATSGKARDFGLRLTVASGITTAPELVLPQGVTCENADGEAPEIGADGAATILYFTETASGVFLVKGEVLQTIS